MPFAEQLEHRNFRYTPKVSVHANGTYGVVIVIIAMSGPDSAIEQTFEPPVSAATETEALRLGCEWTKIWIDSQN